MLRSSGPLLFHISRVTSAVKNTAFATSAHSWVLYPCSSAKYTCLGLGGGHLMLFCEQSPRLTGGWVEILTELLRMASIFSSSTDPLSTLLLYASNCWRSFRSRQVCTPKHNQIPTQPSVRGSLFMSLFLCPWAQGRDNKLQLACTASTEAHPGERYPTELV